MSNGSIPLDRVTQVLTLFGPGSKLLPNITWFSLLLGPLVTVILLLIFGFCLHNILSSLFFLRTQWFPGSADGDAEIWPHLGKDPAGIITEVILGLLTRQARALWPQLGRVYKPLAGLKKLQKTDLCPSFIVPIKIAWGSYLLGGIWGRR